jgi:hypothetical protein
MKKNSKEFEQIEILKERQKLRILEQEIKMKSGIRELSENLTGVALARKLKESLFSGPALAMKLGFLAVSLISQRIRRRRRK